MGGNGQKIVKIRKNRVHEMSPRAQPSHIQGDNVHQHPHITRTFCIINPLLYVQEKKAPSIHVQPQRLQTHCKIMATPMSTT